MAFDAQQKKVNDVHGISENMYGKRSSGGNSLMI